MEAIAVVLKILNMYSHAAHNLASKSLFFQDHDYLGELYEAYDEHYDEVIERMIGLGLLVDITQITMKACQAFSQMDLTVPENIDNFKKIIELERALLQAIKIEYPDMSIGTQQLVGDIADTSEARLYKLQQRVKK
jgi:DNA-binding ferritin-like protein